MLSGFNGVFYLIGLLLIIVNRENWMTIATLSLILVALGTLDWYFKKQEKNREDRIYNYLRHINKDAKLNFIKEKSFGSHNIWNMGFDDGLIYHYKKDNITYEFWFSKFDTTEKYGQAYQQIELPSSIYQQMISLKVIYENGQIKEKL